MELLAQQPAPRPIRASNRPGRSPRPDRGPAGAVPDPRLDRGHTQAEGLPLGILPAAPAHRAGSHATGGRARDHPPRPRGGHGGFGARRRVGFRRRTGKAEGGAVMRPL